MTTTGIKQEIKINVFLAVRRMKKKIVDCILFCIVVVRVIVKIRGMEKKVLSTVERRKRKKKKRVITNEIFTFLAV
jgi:hypothetical protein